MPSSPITIGTLCVRADRACASGDLAALGHIADELSSYTCDPLHGELTHLAERCRRGAGGVVTTWVTLKDQLFLGPAPGRAPSPER